MMSDIWGYLPSISEFSIGASVLWAVSLVVLFFYGVAPQFVKNSFVYHVPTDVLLFDPRELPVPVQIRQMVTNHVEQLEQLGFRAIGYFALPKLVPNVKSISVTFVNEQSGDAALWSAIWTQVPMVELKTTNLEFIRRFENGGCLQTSNSHIIGSFHSPKNDHTFNFWTLKVPSQLYERHTTIAKYLKYGKPIITLLDVFDGDLEAYIQDRVVREPAAYQEKVGLMCRLPEGYGLTWMGAYWFTWRELIPIKQLIRFLRARKSNRIYALAKQTSL